MYTTADVVHRYRLLTAPTRATKATTIYTQSSCLRPSCGSDRRHYVFGLSVRLCVRNSAHARASERTFAPPLRRTTAPNICHLGQTTGLPLTSTLCLINKIRDILAVSREYTYLHSIAYFLRSQKLLKSSDVYSSYGKNAGDVYYETPCSLFFVSVL